MKKILFPAALLLCLATNYTNAQSNDLRNAIGVAAMWNDYSAPIKDAEYFDFGPQKTYGQEFWYGRYLSPSFNLKVPVSVSKITYPNGAIVNQMPVGGYTNSTALTLDAQLHYKFNNGYVLKENSLVAPYLYLGVAAVGGMYDKSLPNDYDIYLPFGVGFKFQIPEGVNVIAEAGYRRSITLDKHNFLLKAGIEMPFGQAKDRDGDGISDKDDACPDIPGLAALNGCPDKDGDGIADKDDACPDVAGLKQFNGCPDKDGDGVTDAEDACPDVAGLAALKGCPDKDGDGITDAEDNCPDVAGLTALKGCPDRDGDGIADKDDKCPDVAGLASLKGCPDRDGDGITDADDMCPEAAGSAALRGCPDRDGDGIADKDDKCPNEKGTVALKGCPEPVKAAPAPVVVIDTDKDGIADKDDKCPTEAGVRENFGCPVKKAVVFSFDNILFETGKSVMKAESYSTLDQIVKIMAENPNHLASIEGHTDSQGNPAINQKLSEVRAKACLDYLIRKGVAKSRLSSTGFGDKVSVADNKTAEGRARNRRVEFKLSLPK
jgi:outer membrane protein OmpA-like peptidoglycan-associated protein